MDFERFASISDEVNISDEAMEELFDLIKGLNEEISADIIIQKTIPIKGIRIVRRWITYSVMMIDNFDDLDFSQKESDYCGLLCIEKYDGVEMGDELLFILCVNDGKMAGVSFFGEHIRFNEDVKSACEKLLSETLPQWRAIQLTLLHPRIKELYSCPKEIRWTEKRKRGQQTKKRKVHYVKRHIITCEGVKREIEHCRKYNCPCWYVVGHWRKYKNGKRVFIHGYWKGVLRDTKQNYDVRERVI